MPPCLTVRNLHVCLPDPGGASVEVVRGVSFEVPEGGFHALVGESGCGKSVTSMALTRLPPADAGSVSGSVRFRGTELLTLSPESLRAFRGRGGIAYVFQDPLSTFNPVFTVGSQLREACPRGTPRRVREARLRELLQLVGFAEPGPVLRSYPCQLSGGMAQRACIAMAMMQEPALLIADEPTTALDVITQRTVLDTLQRLVRAANVAVLLITHNLALVSHDAQTVSVLYAGQVVEDGPVRAVLSHPSHPYCRALLAAVPRLSGARAEALRPIPGRVPPPREWAAQRCTFAPRCPFHNPDKPCSPVWREAGAGHGFFCDAATPVPRPGSETVG